jgi:hypothetical protein
MIINLLLKFYKRKIIKETLEFGYNNKIISLKKSLLMWYTLNNKSYSICPLCFQPMGRRKTIDHIFPKSKGGTDNLNNLQFTHKRCNSIKGDKI